LARTIVLLPRWRARLKIWQTGDAQAWQVLAECSYASYVWDLLTDGSVEFDDWRA